MSSLNLSDIAIATVESVDCRCIIYAISKSEAIHFLKIESTAIILTISSKQKN